jgi:hypothetical protein
VPGATHVLIDASTWYDLPALVSAVPPDAEVLVSVTGAATPSIVTALADSWTRPVGMWLHIDSGYSASLTARDVATVSWLVDLSAVVLSSDDGRARDHAQVVAALLSGEATSIERGAVRVTEAFNRPAPRTAVRVASSTGQPADLESPLTPVTASAGVREWAARASTRAN